MDKKYSSDSERQAAYRLRKKEQAELEFKESRNRLKRLSKLSKEEKAKSMAMEAIYFLTGNNLFPEWKSKNAQEVFDKFTPKQYITNFYRQEVDITGKDLPYFLV